MDFKKISELISNPSWDVIVLFAFIAIGFFYGITAGKSKLISLLFSLYVGGFLFDNFSYLDGLMKKGSNIIELFLLRIAVFLVIVFALNFLFARVLGGYGVREKKLWQVLLLSFLSSGLLFSYVFHLFPVKGLFSFSPIIQNLFASDNAFFWWLTLPLVALFLTRR